MHCLISVRRLVAAFVLLGAVGLLSACVHIVSPGLSHSATAHHVRAGHGPPPHAPAHGYRHKLQDHGGGQIAFDSGIGVYSVVGHNDLFFWEGRFYRWLDGRWQTSTRRDRGWASVDSARLPGRLAQKHNARRGRHSPKHHPAKHRY